MEIFTEFFDLSVISEEWLTVAFYALCYFVLSTLIGTLVGRMTAWALPKRFDVHIGRFIRPIFLLVCLPSLWLSYKNLELSAGALSFSNSLIKAVLYISIFWSLYSLSNYLFSGFRKFAERTPSKLDDQFLPILERMARFTILALGVLIVLQSFGLDVFSLVAGLGLGGLALALAAKDTASNFFGSLMILLDQPFNIGDWVKIGETEGTVEDIGLRSTRIRTFYNSVVVVPNSTMAMSTLDNLGQREFRRFRHIVGLQYDTPKENITNFTNALKSWVSSNPKIKQDNIEINVNGLSGSSVDILVYLFFSVKDWSEELQQRESVILEILRLSEVHKAPIAFPTQTLHIHK